MELIGILILVGLIALFLLLNIFEYLQIKEFNEKFEIIAITLDKTIETVNANSGAQQQEAVLTREHAVEIALMKEEFKLVGKALNISLPEQEGQNLVETVNKQNGRA